MHWIDWTIVAALAIFLTSLAVYARRFTDSVANFLVAGRVARRYVMTISQGVVSLGAVTIMARFELYYKGGFSILWWYWLFALAHLIANLSGWVMYRYRQTRAMTMAQFFEMRYSRKFRIFAGSLAWSAGIINFGIFPAVGARFFMYFCGFPSHLNILGFSVSTFAIVTAVLLGMALFFTFVGGQIAVIVTDFSQGMFCNIMFVIVLIFVFTVFKWSHIVEALSMAPPDASLFHPMRSSRVADFNYTYYLIQAFIVFYCFLAWQGSSGYNASALNPHEARMGKILSSWRELSAVLLVMVVPICAYTLLHHPDFAVQAGKVKAVLATISNPKIQSQATVPLAMRNFLPIGIMGGVCAAMLAGFISTHDTYLHSWGSIFIQDVVLPIRKGKPLTPEQHIKWLRLSIIGVAVFIYLFSLLFRQTEYILMFWAITGSIWLGGAGSAIIGGLYWKKGTTPAAWSTLIVGTALSLVGIVTRQINPNFILNGQQITFFVMLSCIVVYISVSLLSRKSVFNMDKLLHRGEYAIAEDQAVGTTKPVRGFRALIGMGKEFTRGDRVIYISTVTWGLLWTTIFIIGTAYNFIVRAKTGSWVATGSWITYWKFYISLIFVLGVGTTIWFIIGGLRNIKDMFHRLRTAQRDVRDDGTVYHDENESK